MIRVLHASTWAHLHRALWLLNKGSYVGALGLKGSWLRRGLRFRAAY